MWEIGGKDSAFIGHGAEYEGRRQAGVDVEHVGLVYCKNINCKKVRYVSSVPYYHPHMLTELYNIDTYSLHFLLQINLTLVIWNSYIYSLQDFRCIFLY